MQLQGEVLRVTLYIGERDRHQGKALYMALLEFLKKEGASGATVVRGLAGFGARSRIHTATILALSEDLPLRLEWVDQPEAVERLLPQVRRMVDAGLITVEEVNVVQYAPGRQMDPLSLPVKDIMRRQVLTVPSETPVEEVVALLLKRGYRSLPVVDSRGRLQGILTDGDLLRRTGLEARLDLQNEDRLAEQISALAKGSLTAGDIMTHPVITLDMGDTLQRAGEMMVAKNLKRLPVIDKDGHLQGWISRVDVLRTLEHHQPDVELDDEPPRKGSSVAELMYRDVPAVGPASGLNEIMIALESTLRRRVVVIDEESRVLGIITDGDLMRRSRSVDHPGFLDRIRRLATRHRAGQTVTLPEAGETAAELMSAPVITITNETTLGDAMELMLGNQIKRLPVVDENGRLIGLLGRAGLLQGLLQQRSG